MSGLIDRALYGDRSEWTGPDDGDYPDPEPGLSGPDEGELCGQDEGELPPDEPDARQ